MQKLYKYIALFIHMLLKQYVELIKDLPTSALFKKILLSKKGKDVSQAIQQAVYLLKKLVEAIYKTTINRLTTFQNTPLFKSLLELRNLVDVINTEIFALTLPAPEKPSEEWRIKAFTYIIGIYFSLLEMKNLFDANATVDKLKEKANAIISIIKLQSLIESSEVREFIKELTKYSPKFGTLELPVSGGIEENILDILNTSEGAMEHIEVLFQRLTKRGFKIKFDELKKILKTMISKGLIGYVKFSDKYIVIIGNKRQREADQEKVLELALLSEYLTIEQICSEFDWTEMRARVTLHELEQKGVARRVSSYASGERWYFPSLYK